MNLTQIEIDALVSFVKGSIHVKRMQLLELQSNSAWVGRPESERQSYESLISEQVNYIEAIIAKLNTPE